MDCAPDGEVISNSLLRRLVALVLVVGAMATTISRDAEARPSSGYPEPIIQWGVQAGETCQSIAQAVYGSSAHAHLLQRYNRIVCVRGAPLLPGLTLVLPASVTQVPTARVTSVNPEARARPPGGGWNTASAGMPLSTNSNVHTLESGRAGVQFVDRSRIYLASNTLVVIYGTASQSGVSRVPPPKVELQDGEVQAGLSALRGDASVDVKVAGGGRVNAASRDAVVQRKGTRTTVAVFDGRADVSSAGSTVRVPKNYGTRFQQAKPPRKPRPLPPAPKWAAGGSPLVVLAASGKARIEARWDPVPKAASYRFEVSRDPKFHSLIVREEIPAKVQAFRAEQMPPGAYYLRVRAIDDEEYLGIASEVRALEVVAAELIHGQGEVQPAALVLSRYGELRLTPSERVEMALDDGAFGPVLETIDLRRMAPSRLRFRVRGAPAEHVVPVQLKGAEAAIAVMRQGDGLQLAVTLQGVGDLDVPERVGPKLRVRAQGSAAEVPLALAPDPSAPAVPGTARLVANMAIPPEAAALRIDVLDQRGRLLGSTSYRVDTEDAPADTSPEQGPPPVPRIGTAAASLVGTSAHTNLLLWSPTAPNAAVLGGGIDSGAADDWEYHGYALATGSLGPMGVEALLRTSTNGSNRDADTNAWLGLRLRAFRHGDAAVELGPALRVGLPVSDTGPPAQLEPAFGVGGVDSGFSWVANLGTRLRLAETEGRVPIDPVQIYLVGGGTYDLLWWLRAQATLDGHLFIGDEVDGAGGVSLGLEGGTWLFGGLSARLSPFNADREGLFSALISLGIREPPTEPGPEAEE